MFWKPWPAVELKKVLSVTKHGFVFWAQRKPNTRLEIYKAFQDRLTFRLAGIWAVCLLIVLWKKLAFFYELRFSRISLNISLSDSVLETEILQAKVLNSTAELSQFVNYCRLWTLSMVRYFWQLESCSAKQIISTILTRTLISLL